MLFGGVALNVLGRALFDATGHVVSLMIPGATEFSRNALMALVFALWRGLRRPGLIAAPRETVQVSAAIFIVLIGAGVFGFLLSVSQIPFAMAETIREAAGRRDGRCWRSWCSTWCRAVSWRARR